MKITKEQYDALTTEQKKLWKKDGEEYALAGDTEIAAEARRARDREKTRADEAEAKLVEVTERLEALEGDDVRKNKDVEGLEKRHNEKVSKMKADHDKLVATLKTQLEKVMIDDAVNTIAGEIFVKPSRDARLLRDRVSVDYDGETPVIKIKDKDGKVSVLTLEDLKKETVDNPEFADILVGSKASGSGGTGGNQGGGAPKQPKDMTEADRVELYRKNPIEFRRLFPTQSA